MKGDFISNAEVNSRYLNQNKNPKTIEVHDQDRVLSYAHSKPHMSPVKIHGVNINKSNTIKRANRIYEIDTNNCTIPAISVTRNGVGFKSVETTSKTNSNQNAVLLPKQKGKIIKNEREIFLSQKDIEAIKSQERIDNFKNFCIYGNNKSNSEIDNVDKHMNFYHKKQSAVMAKATVASKLNMPIKSSANTNYMTNETPTPHDIGRISVANNSKGIPKRLPKPLASKNSMNLSPKSPAPLLFKANSHKVQSIHYGSRD